MALQEPSQWLRKKFLRFLKVGTPRSFYCLRPGLRTVRSGRALGREECQGACGFSELSLCAVSCRDKEYGRTMVDRSWVCCLLPRPATGLHTSLQKAGPSSQEMVLDSDCVPPGDTSLQLTFTLLCPSLCLCPHPSSPASQPRLSCSSPGESY